MTLPTRSHLPAFFLICGFAFAITSLPAGAQSNFGSVDIGSNTSSTVTVTIPGATTLSSIAVVTQGASGLDFTSLTGGTCVAGKSYAAASSCTVLVAFTPKFVGTRYGAVVLSNPNGVVGTAYLQGAGAGPQKTILPSFQVTVADGGVVDGIANWWPIGVAVDGAGSVYFTNTRQPFQLFKEVPSTDN